MQEIPHTKLKVTQTASWQKVGLCKGLSKYKNSHTKTHYRQELGGGWKYRLGTVSDTCQLGFKPGYGAQNLTLYLNFVS